MANWLRESACLLEARASEGPCELILEFCEIMRCTCRMRNATVSCNLLISAIGLEKMRLIVVEVSLEKSR